MDLLNQITVQSNRCWPQVVKKKKKKTWQNKLGLFHVLQDYFEETSGEIDWFKQNIDHIQQKNSIYTEQ